ncbi:hypothetical protein [Bacillus sp. FJAT-29814]|nr:hypothetical protein [Bacillus sp. FJAT-29814]
MEKAAEAAFSSYDGVYTAHEGVQPGGANLKEGIILPVEKS